MFRTLRKFFLPNPLDSRLKKCARRGGKKVLLGWNRGLGDIALGLFAIIQRIREIIPDAEISFLTRSNLRDGFSLLRNIKILVDPDMARCECTDLKHSLGKLGVDPKSFDLMIERPSPTDWVSWQRGKVTPRLQWDPQYENLWKKFDLPDGFTYIGVQAVIETSYGAWRNWPLQHWERLFSRLEQLSQVKVILFGSDEKTQFPHKNLIDLRGKTTLFELLSIVRGRMHSMILPDSGILSMVYYLDVNFPLHVISLWGDPNHGILKQAVPSPNLLLKHTPLIGTARDLSTVSPDLMMNTLFPVKPLLHCQKVSDAPLGTTKKVGCILLAGGQGTRLGVRGPKGTFQILGKSLFQWICEKAPAQNFPIAVMTSPLNHEETIDFFTKNNNFGREVYFFQQEMNEQLPNGNGAVFCSFAASGLAKIFAQKEIDLLMVIPVENPLADPADLRLIGFARECNADVVIKCVPRESPSMGALVEREGRIEIVEYIDLDPEAEYKYSNTGMLAISFPFFLKMKEVDLPLHWVKKKGMMKGEKFIFDVFPFGQVSALCYEKKSCYAPVKSKDSIVSVQEILNEVK